MANMYYPLLALSASCLFPSLVRADVTIYGLFGSTTAAPIQSAGASTSTAATTTFVTTSGPPSYTGLAAYNPVYYAPPAIPSPAPANQFAIGVPSDQTLLSGISIPLPGTFFGFSIEMSVANQLSESSFLYAKWNVRGREERGGVVDYEQDIRARWRALYYSTSFAIVLVWSPREGTECVV
ncbi:hypothetical protein LXA43DRAFT_712585 [Ganoderma leucocontextum]|nr:hypothetical protein LXA43DRAFT_712585 [Ganoderma leucocontextum]